MKRLEESVPAGKGVMALADAVSNSIRLALLEWREIQDGLPWRSCVYIMRKIAGESGPIGVSILLLLQTPIIRHGETET